MIQKQIQLYLLLILVSLASCTSEKIEPNIVQTSLEYIPIEDGQEEIFEIYELDYNIFGVDTLHIFQKERLALHHKDDDSLYAIVSVLTSETEDGEYESVSTQSITIERNQIIENRNNVRYVTLELPLEENLRFDVNAFNLENENLATIKNLATDVSITDFLTTRTFNQALEVEIENTNNIILSINHTRIYQKDKGLVYELDENLDQQPGQDPIGFKKLKIRL